MSQKITIKPGEFGLKEMPYSEACMHMKIAGEFLQFQITESQYPMVQLFKEGRPFSFPVTLGEAGIYRDGEELYYYLPDQLVNKEKTEETMEELLVFMESLPNVITFTDLGLG
jgi:hypothetical protein